MGIENDGISGERERANERDDRIKQLSMKGHIGRKLPNKKGCRER